jgi:hypothetical protein
VKVVKAAGVITVVLAAFSTFIFLNCTLWITARMNGQLKPPPNKFQWAEGWECHGEVWKSYVSGIARLYQTDATIPTVQR